MTLSLVIIINVIADLALVGGLAYVMSRTTRLQPHVVVTDGPAPAAARVRHRAWARQVRRSDSTPLPVQS